MIDCTIENGNPKLMKNKSDTSASKMNLSNQFTRIKSILALGKFHSPIKFVFPFLYTLSNTTIIFLMFCFGFYQSNS